MCPLPEVQIAGKKKRVTIFRSYWKPKRLNEGWPSYFNQKNSTGQPISRQRLSLVIQVVRLGEIPNKITKCLKKTVASERLFVVGQELLSRPYDQAIPNETLLFPVSCLRLCWWASS